MTGVLTGEETQTHGEGCVMLGAEIGGMCLHYIPCKLGNAWRHRS